MSETTVPPFSPGEAVKITIESDEGWHFLQGDFIKLDESGLLYQRRDAGPLAFIPRERILMIEGKV